MSWGGVKVDDQRIRFVLRACTGKERISDLCREFDISRQRGYYWLARFKEGDEIASLKERSRRPHHSPLKIAEAIEHRIVAERKRRPDWGARKIQVLLAREDLVVPACTIHRILQRNQLIHPHHQHPPALKRFQREHPNQLWQMDFKGLPSNLSHGWAPLSVLDDCSRFVVLLRALEDRKTGAEVRRTLEEAFERYGVPDAMLMDHGTPWWNGQHVCGWTRLSIWLMKQGVSLHLAAVRHPQTQGKVERFHRTLEEALHERGFPPQREQWAGWLEEFREEYNQVRPHEALNMATPGSCWRPSPRAYQPNPPAWDYPPGEPLLQVRSSGQVMVEHQEYTISQALAGETIQLKRLSEDRLLAFYRSTCVREINLRKRQSYPVYFSREQRVFEHD